MNTRHNGDGGVSEKRKYDGYMIVDTNFYKRNVISHENLI
jgi:hypothetical protein